MISPLLFALYVNELAHMFREFHCPGIYIDNDFPTFNMLMYTICRLQSSIDILSTFCDRYGLKLNMSKTVIVFRNGGPTRTNEHIYYRGEEITCVTHYKYLGILFSSRLCWTAATQTLASQAEKAIFKLKSTFKICGGVPVTLALDLFDKIILPILLYGSEI